MSETKAPTLTIRNSEPGRISKGANTILELDGKKLPYAKSYKLECDARGITKLTLEMYVTDVEVVDQVIGDYVPTLVTPEGLDD